MVVTFYCKCFNIYEVFVQFRPDKKRVHGSVTLLDRSAELVHKASCEVLSGVPETSGSDTLK